MKSELKLDYTQSKSLDKLIQKSYFQENTQGRLSKTRNFIDLKKSDELYELLKGLNNATVKITNELIDGSLRFLVDETSGLKIYPISLFCIIDENQKYSFY